MSSQSGLRVRQHHRRQIELPIEFVVAEEHRGQVRFGPQSSAVDECTVQGTSVDISPGGMGFSSRHYVPRLCEGRLRVFDPVPVGERPDGTPVREVALDERVKVRRVQMVGQEPEYLVGVSFANPEAVAPEVGERLLVLARSTGSGGPPASEGADA